MLNKDVERRLKDLGFSDIRLFQKAFKIPVTGKADDLTMLNLFGSPQPPAVDRVPLITPEWKKLIRHAWSVRLMAISFLFQALEVAMPYLEDIPSIPRGVLAFLAVVALGGGLFSRFVLQKEFHDANQ